MGGKVFCGKDRAKPERRVGTTGGFRDESTQTVEASSNAEVHERCACAVVRLKDVEAQLRAGWAFC
jgi:hypothetical protein